MNGSGYLRYLRSISGQIAVVMVLSIILALASAAAIVVATSRAADMDYRSHVDVDGFLGALRLIDATPDENVRSEILRSAVRAFPGLHIQRQPAGVGREEAASTDHYAVFLEQSLGPGFRVDRISDASPDSNSVLVEISSPTGVIVRSNLPVLMLPPPLLTPIMGAGLVFVGFSLLLLLVWATRALTAPLSQFAEAAEKFGRDFEYRKLPEHGPEEIRKASQAFNQMGARLKRLIEDRTNMLAAISHDLRTPITRLRLRAEFVVDEGLRTAMVKDLEQLSEMVRSALSFLRDNRVEGSMKEFDLSELIETICKQFAEIGQQVTFTGEHHLLMMGRPDAISRAVTNLVENALKFGTTATVNLRAHPDGGVAVEVDDDGPGISDLDPERLIRPFVRGDNARTLKPQSGFGLGLTIANSIVEAHGGQLTLRNRERGGLSARLEFPAAAAQPPAQDHERLQAFQGEGQSQAASF